MTHFSPATQSSLSKTLERFERDLKTKIRAGGAPFLGAYATAFGSMGTHIANMMGRCPAQESRLAYFCDGLHKWPAVYGSFLTAQLALTYGSSGSAAVYQHIEKAIACPVEGAERKLLFNAFVSACRSLGLTVSGQNSGHNYMVTEYMRQTGIPKNALPELIKGMLNFTDCHGLPLIEDEQAVVAWQRSFSEVRGSSFSRYTLNVLSLDEDAYYARAFLASLNGTPPDQLDKVQSALYEEIESILEQQDRKSPVKMAVSLPEILFQDEGYGVFLPARDRQNWNLSLDGHEMEVVTRRDGVFVPLTHEHFQIVSACNMDVVWERPLWNKLSSNQFLIFRADDGALVASESLKSAIEEPKEKTFLFKPGTYQVLTRFQPDTLIDFQQISEDPLLFHLTVELDTENEFLLTHGSATALLKAEAKPCLALKGETFQGTSGSPFFYGAGLRLFLSVPEEFRNRFQDPFILKVGVLGHEPIQIPVSDGQCDFPLGELLSVFPKGMTLLFAQLSFEGSAKRVAYVSGYVWLGLTSIEKRVVFIGSASNLILESSENVRVTPNSVSFRDRHQNTFRLVFDIGERHIAWLFQVPGLFLSLISKEVGQIASESFVNMGSVLPTKFHDHRLLRIYNTEPACLRLGESEWQLSFSRCGYEQLPLKTLADNLLPGCHELTMSNPYHPDEPDRLIHLIMPHQVTSFTLERRGHVVKAHIRLSQKATRVRYELQELLEGQCFSGELVANDLGFLQMVEQKVEFDVDCHPDRSGSYGHSLILHALTFPEGIYTVSMEFLIEGRWGSPRNEHQDVHMMAFTQYNGVIGGVESDLSWEAFNCEPHKALERFRRLHPVLTCCHALEAWEHMTWLSDLWHLLLEKMPVGSLSPEMLCLLLRTAMSRGEQANPYWIPSFSVISFQPYILCQEASFYLAIPEQERKPVFGSILKSFRDLAQFGPLSPLAMCHSGDISGAFLGGFEDLHFVESRNEAPRNFRLSKYREALADTDISEDWFWLKRERWTPGRGDYLGPLHLRFAQTRLEENFHQPFAGHSNLRGSLLHLTRYIDKLPLSDVFDKLKPPLVTDHWLMDSRFMINPEAISRHTEDEDFEGLRGCRRLLAVFAKVCRLEPRQPGCLTAFWTSLMSSKSQNCAIELGHLLYLGSDLFSFYLILWEMIFKFELDGGNHDGCESNSSQTGS